MLMTTLAVSAAIILALVFAEDIDNGLKGDATAPIPARILLAIAAPTAFILAAICYASGEAEGRELATEIVRDTYKVIRYGRA